MKKRERELLLILGLAILAWLVAGAPGMVR